MGLFSSNKSSTNNQATYNTTDNSANAAEGAIAAGAGATVNITTADPGVMAKALDTTASVSGMALAANQNTALGALESNMNTAGMALAANQNVSTAALDTTARAAATVADVSNVSIAAQNALANQALATNRDVSRDAFDTTGKVSALAINTTAGLASISARERQDVLNTTTTALQSQGGLASKIADLTSAALERSQTPDSAVTKQLLWAVVAIVAAVFLFGGKGAAKS